VTIVDELLEIDAFDGKQRTILNYTAPIHDLNGRIEGAVIVNQDSTDRMKAEDQLKEKNDELEAMNEELTSAMEELEATNEEIISTNHSLHMAESALRESEARLKSLHDASFGGIVIHDNSMILECNQGLADITGYTIEDLVGRNILSLIAAQSRAVVQANIDTGYNKPYEVTGLRRDGSEYSLRLEARDIRYREKPARTAEFRDITRQKDTERTLSNTQAHLSTLVKTIPDLIWLKDADGVYLACNTAFERFFGAGEADIAGKTDYDFVHRELADFFREHDRKAMNAGRPTVNEEWITFADDGHQALLETIKTPMFNNRGELIGVLGIGRDISARKQAEEEIKKQLAEKEILLREVHHRIKNNFAGVESFLLLQMNASESHEAKAVLRDSMARVRGMSILYDKLLLTGDYQDISVRAYLDDLIECIVAIAGKQEKISVRTQIDDFRLDTKTAISVGTIVNELLTNVFKHAFIDSNEGIVTILLKKTGQSVQLTVSDNGKGIDRSRESSTGLGLAIVKMLVGHMQGKYAVETGVGTTSTISFVV
jgi:PAS domain S-box-containing protein